MYTSTIVVLGLRRLIHARWVVRRTLEHNGFRMQKLERRIILQGPFKLGARDSVVFRASVTHSVGARIVWARWATLVLAGGSSGCALGIGLNLNQQSINSEIDCAMPAWEPCKHPACRTIHTDAVQPMNRPRCGATSAVRSTRKTTAMENVAFGGCEAPQ